MAKRKRLTPAQPSYLDHIPADLETKSMPVVPPSRAPIAQVAGDAAAASALEELAGEMRRARDQGRLIQDLPLGDIDVNHLVRDRMDADPDELEVLLNSIQARGQQTPIEVVALDGGRFGLISGWRRMAVLEQLYKTSGDRKFATVQALIRQPETAADAYVAMVEENEIRVGLSYYERARVAAKSVQNGVFETEKKALQTLFSAASRSKRSKIRSFLTVYQALDGTLRFPMSIGERLGLRLAKVLDENSDHREIFSEALSEADPQSAEAELTCLSVALDRIARNPLLDPVSEPDVLPPAAATSAADMRSTLSQKGIDIQTGDHHLTMSGPAMTEALRDKLLAWLQHQL